MWTQLVESPYGLYMHELNMKINYIPKQNKTNITLMSNYLNPSPFNICIILSSHLLSYHNIYKIYNFGKLFI